MRAGVVAGAGANATVLSIERLLAIERTIFKLPAVGPAMTFIAVESDAAQGFNSDAIPTSASSPADFATTPAELDSLGTRTR